MSRPRLTFRDFLRIAFRSLFHRGGQLDHSRSQYQFVTIKK